MPSEVVYEAATLRMLFVGRSAWLAGDTVVNTRVE